MWRFNLLKINKRILPKTLLGRSLLIIFMPLFLVQLVTILVFFERHWDTTTRLLANNIASSVQVLVEDYNGHNFPEVQKRALNYFHTQVDNLYNHSIPASTWWQQLWEDSLLSDMVKAKINSPSRVQVKESWITIEVKKHDAVLQFHIETKRLYARTTSILFMWSIGSSVLFLFVAALFMRNQIRPLKQLAWIAEEFGKGREIGSFKVAGASEVRQVGTAFNVMRERIRRHLVQRTEFLAGVSHDLRTPLARMELQLAMLNDREAAKELQTDVHEMTRMIDEYLAFVRGEGEESVNTILFKDLVSQALESCSSLNMKISQEIPDNLEIRARIQAMKRTLVNLIENANRYGDHLCISAYQRSKKIEILLDDNGTGIAIEHRRDVFRPFYRLDPSRNQATGGVGLGLSIVKNIVATHGGRVRLADSPQGGLRVQILLPS